MYIIHPASDHKDDLDDASITDNKLYGAAIHYTVCEDGMFFVHNGEYISRVNYCPITGEKAPKQIGDNNE